jgi:electron transport complex protein RnfG
MLVAIRKNGLTLALFACACTGLVAVTQALTKQTILSQEQAHLKQLLDQVIPSELYDNELSRSCSLLQSELLGSEQPMPAYIATLKGAPSAIAIESIAPDGYNGSIKLITGIDQHGVILGSRVLVHNETPGLGDKVDIRKSDWILSFSGKQLNQDKLSQWQVRKDGGQFDQFTGATITPRAVVKAVKNTLSYYNQNRRSIFNQSAAIDCGGEHE